MSGSCDNSYGLNAARLAGINSSICERAREIANQVECISKLKLFFKDIADDNCENIRRSLKSIDLN